MIVLDTNVLSELTRVAPDPRVIAWINAGAPLDLVTTAISKAEMLAGAQALDEGRRQRQLIEVIGAVLQPFERSMLEFDSAAAARFADVVTKRRRMGRPIGQMDAQIAAIALGNGGRLATRDTAGFAGVGLEIINPWSA